MSLVVHTVKAYVDCYDVTKMLKGLLMFFLCSSGCLFDAGGALLAGGCDQVQLAFRGIPARC